MNNARETTSDITKRDTLVRWNGWGYQDCTISLKPDDNTLEISSNRYELCGKELADFVRYARTKGVIISKKTEIVNADKVDFIPEPRLHQEFVKWLNDKKYTYSLDDALRVNRSHGYMLAEVVHLRLGKCPKRIPDIVVWPDNHNQVVDIVNAANLMNVVIIPFGGGTSVSGALACPENETRCIVSLDLCRMNRILFIDRKNMICRAESGCIGVELEEQLKKMGLTMGHEPDSIEFSTLGGWVATRASGICKNKYGNIEDIIINVTLVTPKGVIKTASCPRMSSGPDINNVVLGSEGIFGVVTEVTFKICPAVNRRYSSVLFPDFAHGLAFVQEVAREGCLPTALRLHDNYQTMFGINLIPKFFFIREYFKKALWALFFPYIMRFDMNECSGLTVCWDGVNPKDISRTKSRLNEIAKKHKGFIGLESDGRQGYNSVHLAIYFRDFMLNYSCLTESFETSVPWDKVLSVIRNVKEATSNESKRMGIPPVIVTVRLTQVYDYGVCLYFYLLLNYQELFPGGTLAERTKKALEIYEHLELTARAEIIASGGSISHHHGVGKLRKRFLPQMVGDIGVSVMKSIKENVDPNNIFASGNLFDVSKL